MNETFEINETNESTDEVTHEGNDVEIGLDYIGGDIRSIPIPTSAIFDFFINFDPFNREAYAKVMENKYCKSILKILALSPFNEITLMFEYLEDGLKTVTEVEIDVILDAIKKQRYVDIDKSKLSTFLELVRKHYKAGNGDEITIKFHYEAYDNQYKDIRRKGINVVKIMLEKIDPNIEKSTQQAVITQTGETSYLIDGRIPEEYKIEFLIPFNALIRTLKLEDKITIHYHILERNFTLRFSQEDEEIENDSYIF